jgi:hypothetical protein
MNADMQIHGVSTALELRWVRGVRGRLEIQWVTKERDV